MSLDISEMTLSAAMDGLAQKDFSSVELVNAVRDAIAEKDENIGAYLAFDADTILQDASEADALRAKGDERCLLGIPIALKDLFNVEGQPCTCASKMLENYIAPFDATVISKIKAAGAFPAGRLNMDELAIGTTTENSAFKLTKNPVAPDRVPGGSSGGSAAAVAGGMALASLATDSGGSIRLPASYCGCVGFKPSYGRVSRYGVAPYASSLDQVGTMTKTVEDAAILLSAIAGCDQRDQTTHNVPVPDYREMLAGSSLEGLRIGVPREYFVDGVDSEVLDSVRAAIDKFAKAGAHVEEMSLPHTEYAISAYYICSTAEASSNLARLDGVRYGKRSVTDDRGDLNDMYFTSRTEGLGPDVKRRIIFGTFVLSSGRYEEYYVRALKVRTLVKQDFNEAFKKFDVLMTPVTAGVAHKFGETQNDPLKATLNDMFLAPVNMAGICGISIPCGKSSEGLPVGMQIIGPSFGEVTLLRAADACEKELGL